MQENSAASEKPQPGGRNVPVPASDTRNLPMSRDGYGIGGYGTPDIPEDHSDFAATVRRFIGIVIKWRHLVIGAALVCGAIGATYAFLSTPLYTAAARIQIDREPAKIVEGGVSSPIETGGMEFQRTQQELLRSRAMSERVVAAGELDQDAQFLRPKSSLLGSLFGMFSSRPATPAAKEPDSADGASPANRQRAVAIVRAGIRISPVPASRLVDISFTSTDPERAASIANAYANAYIAANLDRRFEASAYAKVFLEDQLKQLKLRLEESDKALLDFAERENMVETGDKQSIAETNLAAANAALGTLISSRIQAEQAWRQVEQTPSISLQQLLNNKVIEGLRIQRNDLKRDYEQKLETFKPNYPEMVELSNKIAAVDKQITIEVDTVRKSLKAAYENALEQEQQMGARIEELRGAVLDLQKKSIRYNILKREVDSNRNLYNNLLQRYKEVDVASGVGANNIFIIDRAQPPGAPSHPQFLKIIFLATFGGLLAGIGVAFLIELLDDRIRSPDDVEKAFGLPLLGLVPATDFAEGLMQDLADPRSPVAESYRSLATSLQFSTQSGLPRSIVITSAGPSEGKSSTAVALARHFAVTGKTVLLVDADLRKPSLHDKLGHSNAVGASNYLTGSCPIQDVIQDTDIANLWLIASGPIPPNAADLLSGSHIYSLISVGLEMFDIVIIDSPPMLGLADAQLLGAAASATIFVVGAGQARRGTIRGALNRLQMARAMPIGIVLTKFNSRATGYGYGYGYGGDYGYGNSAYSYGHTSTSVPDTANRPDANKPKADTSMAV